MLFLNENLLIIIFPIAFFLIFLFVWGIIRFVNIRNEKKKLIKKIQQSGYDQYEGEYDDQSETLIAKKDTSGRGSKLLSSFFSSVNTIFIGKKVDDLDVVRGKFLRAGLYQKNIETAFWGAKILFPFLFLVGFTLLRMTVYITLTTYYTAGIVVLGSLLAFYLPDIWLKQITDKRKERVLKALPDCMDLLVVCVEAGMGLDSAIKRVGDELNLSYPDLSGELNLLNLELRAGKQRKAALNNFAMRTGLSETKSLATLIIQTDKFGTSVAVALKVFSESFRTQRFQRAEEKAAKLPVSILFPLLVFIFPVLFVVILGPAAINIFHMFSKM
ncbi:type II secretion system F family protein [Desulfobacula sp.]|uniref:type II secretion system F family protein n=1 Tax=Desulfobacula sp. TaxID=2593537 RepID=UPI002609D017|nr:type II secretion system F family protein [Desulfobacula sp.]